MACALPIAGVDAEESLLLRCELGVPAVASAGRPVMLRMTLHNPGPADLQVLRWGTPFEGRWFSPFVSLTRDGQPVAYQGPVVKRADPDAASYLSMAAGASASAELDLALPFALTPGHYLLHPHLQLADVAPAGQAPRPRDALRSHALECPELSFVIEPGRTGRAPQKVPG